MDDRGRTVWVCQNRTCRKQGAAKVLSAFQARSLPNVTVVPSACLGQCGNGPMVQVLPDQVWYSRVLPDEVPAIVEQHFIGDRPVAAMLYPNYPRSRCTNGTSTTSP